MDCYHHFGPFGRLWSVLDRFGPKTVHDPQKRLKMVVTVHLNFRKVLFFWDILYLYIYPPIPILTIMFGIFFFKNWIEFDQLAEDHRWQTMTCGKIRLFTAE